MKYIGFLKNHNDVEGATFINQTLGDVNNNIETVNKIINYLNKGVLILGWMGYIVDSENNDLIAPDAYYSDGFWVWPSYFPYYIKKHKNYILDKSFLAYLNKRNFEYDNSFVFDVSKIEFDLSKRLGNGSPDGASMSTPAVP